MDTLLVSGSKNSHSSMVDQMHASMDPKITTRVKLDDCGDVLQDAPEQFAYNLLLFCQGLGLCKLKSTFGLLTITLLITLLFTLLFILFNFIFGILNSKFKSYFFILFYF